MSDTRAAHQCHRDGCDTEARWAVRLCLSAKVTGYKPINFDGMTSIRCCDAHRFAANRYLLDPVHRAEVERAFKETNLPAPDWQSARVEFYPLTEKNEPDRAPPKPVEASRIIPCDRADCVLPARYQIAVKLWRIGQSKATGKPAKILTAFCVCETHRKATKAKHLLDGEAKSAMLGELTGRGYPMPDFRGAELEFVALTGGRMTDPAAFERGAPMESVSS